MSEKRGGGAEARPRQLGRKTLIRTKHRVRMKTDSLRTFQVVGMKGGYAKQVKMIKRHRQLMFYLSVIPVPVDVIKKKKSKDMSEKWMYHFRKTSVIGFHSLSY